MVVSMNNNDDSSSNVSDDSESDNDNHQSMQQQQEEQQKMIKNNELTTEMNQNLQEENNTHDDSSVSTSLLSLLQSLGPVVQDVLRIAACCCCVMEKPYNNKNNKNKKNNKRNEKDFQFDQEIIIHVLQACCSKKISSPEKIVMKSLRELLNLGFINRLHVSTKPSSSSCRSTSTSTNATHATVSSLSISNGNSPDVESLRETMTREENETNFPKVTNDEIDNASESSMLSKEDVDQYYQFSNPEIHRQVITNLIGETIQEQLRFRIWLGNCLWHYQIKLQQEQTNTNDGDDDTLTEMHDSLIFVMLNQFYQHYHHYKYHTLDGSNLDVSFLGSPNRRIAIAQLCLYAGQQAVSEYNHFYRASQYLTLGIASLGCKCCQQQQQGQQNDNRSNKKNNNNPTVACSDDSGCWENHYDLTLGLHNALVECLFAISDFEQVQKCLIPCILTHAKSLDDSLTAWSMKSLAHSASGDSLDAIATCLHVLEKLGHGFHSSGLSSLPTLPASKQEGMSKLLSKSSWRGAALMEPQVTKQAKHDRHQFNNKRSLIHPKTAWEFHKLQRRLMNKSNETILRMPQMTNPNALAAMKFLNFLFSHSFRCNQIQYIPLITLRMMNLTLDNGLCPLSAYGFGLYAMMITMRYRNLSMGHEYGQLALRILKERFPSTSRQWVPRVTVIVWVGLSSWIQPIRRSFAPLWDAHKIGMETGDVEYALIAVNIYCYRALFLDVPLHQLRAKITGEVLDIVREHQHVFAQRMMDRLLTIIDCLTGDGNVYTMLLGHESTNDGMQNTGRYLDSDVDSFSNPDSSPPLEENVFDAMWIFQQMLLAFCFNELDTAEQMANLCCTKVGPTLTTMKQGEVEMYIALIFMNILSRDQQQYATNPKERHRHRRLGRKQKRQYLFFVKKAIKHLQEWVHHAPHNFGGKLLLLQAQMAAYRSHCRRRPTRRNHHATSVLFNITTAIAMSGTEGFLLENALCHEFASRHILSQCCNPNEDAHEHLVKAIETYQQWGAHAIAQRLRETYSHVFEKSAQ